MASRFLNAALYISRRFKLTLRFWLVFSVGCILLITLLVAAYVSHLTSPPIALAFLVIAASVAARWFRNWPGVYSPATSLDGTTARPAPPGAVRCVCVSDTHGKIEAEGLPAGDILIVAGDFTLHGTRAEVVAFNHWLGRLPHRHKVVIAGNHDICCDSETHMRNLVRLAEQREQHAIFQDVDTSPEILSEDAVRELLSNARYLVGEMCELEVEAALDSTHSKKRVVSVFGSPYTDPIPGSAMSAFARGSDERRRLWRALDRHVDILVSHGPPCGVLDRIFNGMRVGCEELTRRLGQLEHAGQSPTYHVFGHVHESRGVQQGAILCYRDEAGRATIAQSSTTFVNAASVNIRYQLRPKKSKAIVFDLLPSLTETSRW